MRDANIIVTSKAGINQAVVVSAIVFKKKRKPTLVRVFTELPLPLESDDDRRANVSFNGTDYNGCEFDNYVGHGKRYTFDFFPQGRKANTGRKGIAATGKVATADCRTCGA